MSDKFVTVMTFNQGFEAQLAKNLLENEGIASMLNGELTAEMMPFGQAGGSDQIVLQVREDDAQRATGILATVAAAKLDKDWEEQTEAGVWICSLCGEPVSNQLSMCYSCETPRESIRTSVPRDQTAIQPNPSTLPTGEDVQIRDEIARTRSPSRSISPAPVVSEPEESETTPPLAPGDDLARHAFGAAFFGILTVLLLPISWYYLARLLFYPDELSQKGLRYFYGALFLNGLFVVIALFLGWTAAHWR